jgi:ADP-ribose pyrophosphatase YjhB (NUDIX family)
MVRFCPRCAQPLVARDVEGRDLPACPDCEYIAFRDPKVVAVALLLEDGGIWLIRRAIEPCVGEWALPGGYVDWDEHPSAAAVRECREEIGCDVEVERLVGVQHAAFADGGVVVIGYAGRIVAGTPGAGSEVLEVGHFALPDVPPLAFETHRALLAHANPASYSQAP